MSRNYLLLVITWLIMVPSTTLARESAPDILFTQVVQAVDSEGIPYPTVTIDPESLPFLTRFSYELGHNCQLVIKTNASDAEERGLDMLASVIRRCYEYLERNTGCQLHRGVLLYLIEFDDVPLSYKFTAAFPSDCPWSEVRLVPLERDRPLFGDRMGRKLKEFIYDTLPHELGHEILEGFGFDHAWETETDGQGTRWFSDGVCELLAKGFCRSEQPGLWRHHLAQRDIDTVLQQPTVRDHIFRWTVQGELPVTLESDLYGASFLVMSVWTAHRPLPELLQDLSHRRDRLAPASLLSRLKSDTGLAVTALLDEADRLGEKLTTLADATREPHRNGLPPTNRLAPR